MLKNYFKPDLIKPQLSEVSIDWIKSNNFDFVILDVDNTMVIKGTDFIDEITDKWLIELKNSCNTILICSNNTRSVAYRLAKRYSCYGFNLALKPFKVKVNQFLKKNKIQYRNACVIGDQLFTDIWLGKRMGMHTVLIQSNYRKDYGLTKLFRLVENKLLEQENVK
jgi:hypothetical protein